MINLTSFKAFVDFLQNGEQRLESRWELINRAFTKPIATSYDLEVIMLNKPSP